MSDELQKKILSRNLLNYLNVSKHTQKEVADSIGVSPQTFNTWCQGIALPRMGKLQLLADFFNINKSDLLEDKHPAASSRSQAEEELLRIFHRLNEDGKKDLLKYARMSETSGMYIGAGSDQSGDGDIFDDNESLGRRA